MTPDDLNSHRERFEAAVAKLNAGEPFPEVDPDWIERTWEITRQRPLEHGQNRALGLGSVAASNPQQSQITAEQQIALAVRCLLLEEVALQGVLDEYLHDESKRHKLFAAAATIKCDKNDFGEAVIQKQLRESAPEAVEKLKEDLKLEGQDPDHPAIYAKFLAWLQESY